MVRLRSLVLAMAAASALASEAALGLGLGNVKLDSALNQPLIAEIELLDASQLENSEIRPRLASAAEFSSVGIERPYFLSGLKFATVERGGRKYVRITSTNSVREPYLNFLIEVVWPNGRLLREYTLLLDPPLYAPDVVATAAPQLPRSTARQSAPSRTSSRSQQPLTGSEYRIASNDTLWRIAERYRQPGTTVQQTMQAIRELNPQAFINGDINLLKQGELIRLPSKARIQQNSHSQAVAMLSQQARRRPADTGDSSRQMDATPRTQAVAAPSTAAESDKLRLVNQDQGNAREGSDLGQGGDSAQALQEQLSLAEENLASSQRENAELKERLEDLQGQMEKLQRLMELQTEKLALLQTHLSGEGAVPDEPSSSLEPAAPEPSTTEPEVADVAGGTPADSAPEVAEPVAATLPATEEAVVPAEPKPLGLLPKTEKPKPVPPPAPAAADDEGLLGFILMQDPMLLAGGGGVVLLLLLLGLVKQRQKKAREDAQSVMLDDHPSTEPESAQPFAEAVAKMAGKDADDKADDTDESVSGQDALADADVYIAYGRFGQAAEILSKAIEQDPQRTDLKLKLMEVRAEMGDAEGFLNEESGLRAQGVPDSQLAEVRSRYPGMATLLATGAVGAAAATAAMASDDLLADTDNAAGTLDDFDLGLDDLDLGLPDDSAANPANELDEPEAIADTSAETELPATDADDFSFDLDLDFAEPQRPLGSEPAAEAADTEDAAQASAETEEVFPDLADFDLGALSDSTLGGEERPAAASETPDAGMPSIEDELAALDFSLDGGLDAPAGTEGATADTELPDDFDLSLDFGGTSSSDSLSAELDALSKSMGGEEEVADLSMPGSSDDDFGFLEDTDENATKLDLAKAYIEMGDDEGARDILGEILQDGNETQQGEAREMLADLK